MQPFLDPMTAAAITSAALQVSFAAVGIWAVRAARAEKARIDVRLASFERERVLRESPERRLYGACSPANAFEGERSLYLD